MENALPIITHGKLMANLMDQHMADKMGQVLSSLAPVIEKRRAIEKNHIHALGRFGNALVVQ